jgi:hypothetical protein
MGLIVIFFIAAILIGILISEAIVWASETFYADNRVAKMSSTNPIYANKCGRVHLGPVTGVPNERCNHCWKFLTLDEKISYWKTQRAAVECKVTAMAWEKK